MSPFRRKLRKLRRNPKAFFRDMSVKRIEKPNVVHNAMTYANPNKRWRGRHKFVVISAVYNVEKYLDAYFRSIVRQSLDFKRNIKIVLVDDGSEDSSAEIINMWAHKYPDNIFYLRKENGGQASARNVGIDFVEGRLFDTDFVTFIDPDDFVELSYFQIVDEFVAAKRGRKRIQMVSCNLIFYDEPVGRFRDQHPLRYRFKDGDRLCKISNLGQDLQLSTNSAFFGLGVIVQNRLRFREDIRPSFEDAHFVARYIAVAGAGQAAFLQSARYFYRKREDGSSTLDQSVEEKGLFLDVLINGCLDLIGDYKSRGLQVPLYLQRTILYHCCNYFIWNTLIDRPERVGFLSSSEKKLFLSYLDEVFESIDVDTIVSFELAGVWFYHKVGLLSCFKDEEPPFQTVYIEDLDQVKNQILVKYFCMERSLEKFQIGGKDISPVFGKTIRHDFLDRTFVLERRVWLPLGSADENLTVGVCIGRDGMETRLSLGGKWHPEPLSLAKIKDHFGRTLKSQTGINSGVGRWLLMDRDTQADDNAEHLYRHIRERRPRQPISFVLHPDSHDWSRLEADGFDLLAYGSLEHEQALRDCSKIISSHVDRYVVDYFRDSSLDTKDFIFLQHGITKDDLSAWLNRKNINCFVTSSTEEYRAIVGDGTRYKFTKKEVLLTGFPRHDSLIAAQANLTTDKVILVMPTWRESLVGKSGNGNSRLKNPDFMNSAYAVAWGNFIRSERLKQLAEKAGYSVVFFPHVNVHQYIGEFDIPNYIKVIGHDECRIQEIFCKSSLLVTDYSSVAFEMAYLEKETIYYQFDKANIFGRDHFYQKGYFDYVRDGFGPVCESEDEVFSELENLLAQDAKPDLEYFRRMESFFAFRDGGSCERVLQAILALDDPDEIAFDLGAMQDHAMSAEMAGRWDLAEARWRTVLAHIDENTPNHIKDFAQHRMVYAVAMQGGSLLDDLRAGMQSFDGGSAKIIDLRQQQQLSNGAAESRKWSL